MELSITGNVAFQYMLELSRMFHLLKKRYIAYRCQNQQ